MLNTKFWQKYFRVYDTLNLFIPYQILLSTLSSELDIEKNDKILEAGCGTGNLALAIKKRGGEIIGLDNCSGALAVYRNKDSAAKMILSDLTKSLPFPNAYFDKIVCNNTLYIIEKKKRLSALYELRRILKPGGKLVLSNPIEKGNPMRIYWEHIKISIKTKGTLKTMKDLVIALIPTLKIFYFNFQIKKACKYSFFSHEDQREILNQAGFINISETKLIYAKQNILNSALNPK